MMNEENNKGWEKVKEEIAYLGYRNIVKKTFRLPNQKIIDFDIVQVPSFVSIAALTLEREVILVEQYRPGPEKVLLSFPEGQIDQNEKPEDAVKRELLEETGYRASQVRFLKEIPTAYSNNKKLCFLANNCVKVQEQRLDDTEFINVKKMSIPEFKFLLKNPDITNFTNVDIGYLMLETIGF